MKPVMYFLVFLILAVTLANVPAHGESEYLVLKPEFEVGPELGLRVPLEIRTQDNGDVVILDSGNSRLVVLDSMGILKYTIGENGNGSGELFMPEGMDIDNKGRIIVADTGNKKIVIFDKDGQVYKEFTPSTLPTSVTAWSEDNLLVSNSFRPGESLFDCYDYEGNYLGPVGKRLTPYDVGLDCEKDNVEQSLNFFTSKSCGEIVVVGFCSLGLAKTLTPSGIESDLIPLNLQGISDVHLVLHQMRGDKLAQGGRSLLCSDVDYFTLAADLEAWAIDGDTHFISVISDVALYDGKLRVLSNGKVYLINSGNGLPKTLELKSKNGGPAYSHIFHVGANGDLFTADTTHHHVVRKFIPY